MKRPILGLLAAAILSAGLLGAPALAATSDPTASTVRPTHEGHDHGEGGYKYSHPDGRHHHGTRHHHRDWDDDGDDDGGGPCRGVIVICL